MRPHTYKNMNMIGHAVYLQHLMVVILKNAGNILMQTFFPLIANQSGPIFHRENKLDMKLSVCIWHNSLLYLANTNRSYGTKYHLYSFLPTSCSYGTYANCLG